MTALKKYLETGRYCLFESGSRTMLFKNFRQIVCSSPPIYTHFVSQIGHMAEIFQMVGELFIFTFNCFKDNTS